jgi:hypothetical protein
MKQQNSGLGVEEEHGAAQWSEEGGPEARVEVEKDRCDRRRVLQNQSSNGMNWRWMYTNAFEKMKDANTRNSLKVSCSKKVGDRIGNAPQKYTRNELDGVRKGSGIGNAHKTRTQLKPKMEDANYDLETKIQRGEIRQKVRQKVGPVEA